ncbi:HNH endonuclease [Burkholderia gladioli]|uniref:HNH endonuclease n=1 Tax=Burkholderia gladioli TaxID=28095 RepID=UPI003132A0E9
MTRLKTLKPRLQSLGSRVQTVEPGSWRTGKTSSSARGYDYQWQKLRAAHLKAHPHCVFCLRDLGMAGWSPEAVVIECAMRGVREPVGTIGDHVVPHRGDDRLRLDPANVQTLCKPHHDGEKARIERHL